MHHLFSCHYNNNNNNCFHNRISSAESADSSSLVAISLFSFLVSTTFRKRTECSFFLFHFVVPIFEYIDFHVFVLSIYAFLLWYFQPALLFAMSLFNKLGWCQAALLQLSLNLKNWIASLQFLLSSRGPFFGVFLAFLCLFACMVSMHW